MKVGDLQLRGRPGSFQCLPSLEADSQGPGLGLCADGLPGTLGFSEDPELAQRQPRTLSLGPPASGAGAQDSCSPLQRCSCCLLMEGDGKILDLGTGHPRRLPLKTLPQARGFFIPLSPFRIFSTCIRWSPLPVWAQPFRHLYPQSRVYCLTYPHNNLGRRCYPLITEESQAVNQKGAKSNFKILSRILRKCQKGGLYSWDVYSLFLAPSCLQAPSENSSSS